MSDRAPEILVEVIRRPVEARAEALERACAGDPGLRARVEVLLRAHDAPQGLPTQMPRSPPPRGEEGPGSVVGRYKLLEEIGEGGFGRVFMAEQREPVVRRVAVKVIKLGMDTRQVVARFEAERQALALMDHPGIATVLDGGATDSGRPYFVMELVKGLAITRYCDEAGLGVPERLALFLDVCAAVQHAHQKGVVHRDLKPGNVLVAERDGRARPKVIDFGIAKATSGRLTDKTLFTEFRQFIGTPAYMSPEQTLGAGVDVDTRSDVYSLGVILYELLTGTTPLDADAIAVADFAELQRMIREAEAPRPSTRVSTHKSLAVIAASRRIEPRRLGLLLRGDLDWVVLKALDKDRNQRYETVAAMAEDVRRYLAHQPVSATPPSAAYRLRKFIRRNRGAVLAGSFIAATLVLGLAGTAAGLVWAVDERARANTQAARAVEVKEFLESMLLSASPWVAMGEDTTLMRRIADQALAKLEAGAIADPEIEADLSRTIAHVLMQIGDFARAEPVARRAWVALQQRRGENSPEALDAAHLLGQILNELNRLDEGAALAETVLQGRRGALGPSDPATIDAMNHLVEVRRFQGRFDEAEALARELLELATAGLGPDDERTLTAMRALAFVLSTRNAPAEQIEPLLRGSLDALRRTKGPDHPSTLEAQRHLASFVGQRLGRMDECEAMLRDVLDRTIRVSGEEHPASINLRANLGVTLDLMGRPAEAEPFLRKAWEIGRRKFGPDHEMTLFPAAGLARVLARLERLDEAESLHREATAGMRRLFGDAHFETLDEIASLAATLRQNGKPAEAEPLIAEAVAGLRTARGTDHPHTRRAMRRQGAILADLGRFTDGERVMTEAEKLVEDAGPAAADEVRATARAMADFYDAWHKAEPGAGHDARAASWRERAAAAPTPEGR